MFTAWACPALAQEIATGNSDRAIPRQSSSSTLPAASAQAAASSRASSKTKTRAATPPAAKPRKLNCRRAADPNRRRFGCKDQTFDWADTLTRDWFGIRADARDHGIALTASYYSALQTNATGGGHQVWGYVGQFTGGIDFDFEKLLHVPGMSLYFSHYWGSGSNLTGTIGSVFPVTTNLAVGDHLGEIYLQQKLDHGNLTLAAGRLAADYTFATLPVFSNYVSNGIDSNPVAILTNDHSYVGPPPGLEWGAQAIYNITKKVQAAAGIYNTNQNSANNGNVFALQQQGNKGALVTAQLTPKFEQAYREKLAQVKLGNEWDQLSDCLPSGFPRWLTEPFLREYVVLPDETRLINEQQSEVRRIYTDGRGHVPDDEAKPLWTGDSIGFWDGDTLVVHTIRVTHGQYQRQNPDYSESTSTVERIRMINPNLILYDVTVWDPKGLKAPWHVMDYYTRVTVPGSRIDQWSCEQNNNVVRTKDGSSQFILPGETVNVKRTYRDPETFYLTDAQRKAFADEINGN